MRLSHEARRRIQRSVITCAVAACCALLVSAASDCTAFQTCTAASCDSGAQFEATFGAPATGSPAFDSFDVDVCRNDSCGHAALKREPFDAGSPEETPYRCTPTFGDLPFECTGSGIGPHGGPWTIHFTLHAAGEPLLDGDVYTIHISSSATKTRLLDVVRKTTYKKEEPNGPDCDPTCFFADLSPPAK